MWRICYQKAPQLYISRPRLLMGNFKGFKARPVDGHLQGPLSENSYNCYSGKIWAAHLYVKTVHCSSCNDFHITIPDFEAAYQQAQARNIQVKGLLITNPSYQRGTTMDATTLRKLLAFVSRKNIHLVCYEIYSGSVFSSPKFISMEEILATNKISLTHILIVSPDS